MSGLASGTMGWTLLHKLHVQHAALPVQTFSSHLFAQQSLGERRSYYYSDTLGVMLVIRLMSNVWI